MEALPLEKLELAIYQELWRVAVPGKCFFHPATLILPDPMLPGVYRCLLCVLSAAEQMPEDVLEEAGLFVHPIKGHIMQWATDYPPAWLESSVPERINSAPTISIVEGD
jgi:hypothetical protein